jgi:hypothetical protein
VIAQHDSCVTAKARVVLIDRYRVSGSSNQKYWLTKVSQHKLLNKSCATKVAQQKLLNKSCSTKVAQQKLLNKSCSTKLAQQKLLNKTGSTKVDFKNTLKIWHQ